MTPCELVLRGIDQRGGSEQRFFTRTHVRLPPPVCASSVGATGAASGGFSNDLGGEQAVVGGSGSDSDLSSAVRAPKKGGLLHGRVCVGVSRWCGPNTQSLSHVLIAFRVARRNPSRRKRRGYPRQPRARRRRRRRHRHPRFGLGTWPTVKRRIWQCRLYHFPGYRVATPSLSVHHLPIISAVARLQKASSKRKTTSKVGRGSERRKAGACDKLVE